MKYFNLVLPEMPVTTVGAGSRDECLVAEQVREK